VASSRVAGAVTPQTATPLVDHAEQRPQSS